MRSPPLRDGAPRCGGGRLQRTGGGGEAERGPPLPPPPTHTAPIPPTAVGGAVLLNGGGRWGGTPGDVHSLLGGGQKKRCKINALTAETAAPCANGGGQPGGPHSPPPHPAGYPPDPPHHCIVSGWECVTDPPRGRGHRRGHPKEGGGPQPHPTPTLGGLSPAPPPHSTVRDTQRCTSSFY